MVRDKSLDSTFILLHYPGTYIKTDGSKVVKRIEAKDLKTSSKFDPNTEHISEKFIKDKSDKLVSNEAVRQVGQANIRHIYISLVEAERRALKIAPLEEATRRGH